MDFDIDDDLAALKGLPTGGQVFAVDEEESTLADDWKTLQGVPDFGYVVRGGQYTFDDVALWKVRFFSASPTGPGARTRLWVTYEHVACLWRGPSARIDPTMQTKEGKVLRRFRGDFASFDLTLLDAAYKMRQIRDRLVNSYQVETLRLRKNAQEMLADADKYEQKAEKLRGFNPDAELPADLIEAEEREIEEAIERAGKEG